jgi:hypothetical protein
MPASEHALWKTDDLYTLGIGELQARYDLGGVRLMVTWQTLNLEMADLHDILLVEPMRFSTSK